MAGFSDYLEDKVLDHVFGGNAYTAPGTLYVYLNSFFRSIRLILCISVTFQLQYQIHFFHHMH